MAVDPFALLGVSRSATEREVRQAYRRLARTRHTDRGGDPAEWAKITDAYNTLTDQTAREKFLLEEAATFLFHAFAADTPAVPSVSHVEVRVPFLVALRGGGVDTPRGRLRIPRGCADGATLVVSNRETEIHHRITVAPHAYVSRDQAALLQLVTVSGLEAYRGGPLRLPTPWGSALVRVAPRTLTTGDVLTLPGWGVRCKHQPGSGPPVQGCDCEQGELRVRVTVQPLPADAAILARLEQLLGGQDVRLELTRALTPKEEQP